MRDPGSDKWKQVDLEEWIQYHRWEYFGTPGEEDFQRQTDVMWQLSYVGFEAGEFEPGETYTFKRTWTWIPDPENPEDTGMWEIIIDITFT